MEPVDFLRYVEFNPYEFYLVWGVPREIHVNGFRITGNVEMFIRQHLLK